MVQRANDRLTDAAQQFFEGGIAREVCAQNNGVGYIAHDFFQLGSTAAQRCGSYEDIVLISIAIKQCLKCGQQDSIKGGLLSVCQRFELFR